MKPASDYAYVTARLEREIDAMGAYDAATAQWCSTSTYPVKHLEDTATRYRAYFLESVHTALSHAEPLIAFRACLQAYTYADKGALSTERDYLIACRNRIEGVLSSCEAAS